MEFEKINLEKSWNFVSDLIPCESKFSRATRAFQVPIVHVYKCLCAFYCCTLIFPKFLCTL